MNIAWPPKDDAHLEPADPGDTRFEYGQFPEGMEETPFWLACIDDHGTVYQRHWFGSTEEIFSMIGSFRDHQGSTLEERLAPGGREWELEQEERSRGY